MRVCSSDGEPTSGPRSLEIDEGRDEAVGERIGGGAGERARIDEDRRRDAAPAESDPLGQIGHRQIVGAVPGEHRISAAPYP